MNFFKIMIILFSFFSILPLFSTDKGKDSLKLVNPKIKLIDVPNKEIFDSTATSIINVDYIKNRELFEIKVYFPEKLLANIYLENMNSNKKYHVLKNFKSEKGDNTLKIKTGNLDGIRFRLHLYTEKDTIHRPVVLF